MSNIERNNKRVIGQCPVENCPYYGNLTRDHIIPQKFFLIMAKYGLVDVMDKEKDENIQHICPTCNVRKGCRIPYGIELSDRALQLREILYEKTRKGTLYLPRKDIKRLGYMFADILR